MTTVKKKQAAAPILHPTVVTAVAVATAAKATAVAAVVVVGLVDLKAKVEAVVAFIVKMDA